MPFYVKYHDQEEGTLPSRHDKPKYSSYFPPPMKTAFIKAYLNTIKESDYILGPVYAEGDFQIGVTGTLEYREQTDYAMSRELGEEIGIVPIDQQSLKKIHSSSYGRKKHLNMSVYSLFLRDVLLVPEFHHNVNLSQRSDNKSLKCGCFVYGEQSDIIQLLSRKIYYYYSPDRIIGVGAVQAKDVYELFKNTG